ncbi:MAG: protease modulator HflC [Desulfovibrio sp.]|jgi:membrane protease subunit HflC|nr:protease modulator HflC [Desulfovibrio sp.]
MNRFFIAGLTCAVILGVLASQSMFFVGENQRALVLQLGEPIAPVRAPGINFKLPFVQSAVFLENRILVFDIPKTYSLTADLKTFEIDNYACWRITDPLIFYRKLRSELVAAERLRSIVYSQLRSAIGSKELNEVVYTKRTAIMEEVLQKSNKQAEEYGVAIIDVRIKRTDLPNRQAIFNRMNAERKRMANKYRSEGESEDRRIRSEAEMQRDIILANATRESILIRGSADAKAIKIFADALSADSEFYEFSKSLEVYSNAFKENTRIIFSNEDPLLRYFN